MMKNAYPSDISREHFEPIQKLLEPARKKTKPRVVDLYEVFCALLYVLKSGCQWSTFAVTTANVTDREGALAACGFHKAALSEVKGVLTDGEAIRVNPLPMRCMNRLGQR